MSNEYVYCFDDTVDMHSVEDALSLAALATASEHGIVAVSLDAEFRLNASARTVTINTSSDIGITMNRVFYGFVERGVPTGAFTVTRLRSGLESAGSMS
jgi:hypothetical protein